MERFGNWSSLDVALFAAPLAAERSPEALEKLYDEGGKLSDDEACALAFPVRRGESYHPPVAFDGACVRL